MTSFDVLQFLAFVAVTVALAVPCAGYLARVFAKAPVFADFLFSRIENAVIVIAGPQMERQQNWTAYAFSALIFNVTGGTLLFIILLAQGWLPWNPQHLAGVNPAQAFNIAVAFMTNTDWQSYGGETTLSYFSQMAGLTVQNYLSAATGLAVAFAVIRGFARKENPALGNFYADVVRVTLYILLPLAFIFALFLIWQGVPQNMQAYVQAVGLEGVKQTIAQGPVASQEAIKMLGSNGGGFFNANGAHPYENPTPLTGFAETVAILLLPVALVLAFGRMAGDRRQSWPLITSMTVLFLVVLAFGVAAEMEIHPALAALGGHANMEGKETRFGVFNSVLWTVATTATSNGAVNSMLDSAMPLTGIAPLFNMLIGEVIFGGVGCGLYGILIYVLITVFIAGLMVGRTPEYLCKKIESYEMKLAIIAMMIYPVCVLGGGVISLLLPAGAASITAPGPHGLTQTVYAYASAAANNGTAFAGFNADTVYQNVVLALVMLVGRFGVIVPVLAIAGSLAGKKATPPSTGTFPTHGLMFTVLLTGVIVMFGGLTYFPALALGPVAEHLSLFAH